MVVVDDGSTDDSRDVIARYGNRVTAVLKENGGQASACNAGFARCRGNVVIFLDADDVLLPSAAARVAETFAVEATAVKVQYRMAVIDAEGRATGELKPPSHVPLVGGDLRREELVFPFDLPWMATSGNAFSAEALRRLMPIPEREFAASADWYLQHLVALLGPIVSLDEVCASYRVHGANRYEPESPRLDLAHVRQSVRYAAATRRHLRRLANELELALPPGPILSVADLANRLISHKLEPAAHPLRHESTARLMLGGVVAALRRFNVRWPMKAMFIVWFVAIAVAPRAVARWLAQLFLFAERRRRLNPLLRSLNRPRSG